MTLSGAETGLPKRRKANKGSVSVYVLDGRLRLRWQAHDALGKQKRFSFAFGADNSLNRKAAEKLALQIELDLASNNFDPTLAKYLFRTDVGQEAELGVIDLFNQYVQARTSQIEAKSLEKYQTLQNAIARQFSNLPLSGFGESAALEFLAACQERQLKGETINAYIILLKAVWDWGLRKSLVTQNPWQHLSVRQEPHQIAKPFSEEEVDKILRAFANDFYYDFVLFVMSLGCRPSEAIGLNWSAVSEDCSEVWIGKSYSQKDKRLKATKNNKARTIPISPVIQSMLKARRPERVQLEDAVFTSPQGKRIDLHNFTKRSWKRTLETLDFPYRPFYNARHSQWTKEVVAGMDLATSAYLAGNTPRTMMSRYIGPTKIPRLKDWTRRPDDEETKENDA